MRVVGVVKVIAALLVTWSSVGATALAVPPREDASPRLRVTAISRPAAFEKNLGQAGADVDFIARAGASTFLLARTGLRVVDATDATAPGFELTFGAAKRLPAATGVRLRSGTVNYLQGADPGNWRTAIPTFAEVRYRGVLPGIDLVLRQEESQIEFDFIVGAGADPSPIRLRLAGAESLALEDGRLVLRAAGRELRIQRPKAYQTVRGRRADVPVRWALVANTARFVVGDYDHARPLVIDPVVTAVNRIPGELPRVFFDGADNVYFGTPLASGGFQVTKTTPGGAVVYETLIGTEKDWLHLGAVDRAGNAYVVGSSGGTVPAITQIPGLTNYQSCLGAFDKMLGCGDGVVLKLDPAGAVAFATLIGGRYGDVVNAFAVDPAGRLHIAGVTGSADFPTLHAAQARASTNVGLGPCGGGTTVMCQFDAFAALIDPAVPALVWSTYAGGANQEWAYAIAADAQGASYVTGSTQSIDFPLVAPMRPGGLGFVAKYDADGALVFSGYLGETYVGQAIAIDPAGDILIAGHEDPGWNAFLRKMRPDGTEVATWPIESTFSTNVSGNRNYVWAMTLDAAGNAYLAGTTLANDLPLVNALQAHNAGFNDGFVSVFSPTGQVVFSTYLGGSNIDSVNGIAVDSGGAIVVAGDSYSPDFPLLDESNVTASGSGRSFVLRIDTGAALPLQRDPDKIALPPQQIGETGTRSVTLTNTSAQPITLTSVTLDPNELFGTPYYTLTNGCGAQLAPGANCTLQLALTSPYPGDFPTVVVVDSSVGALRLGATASVLEANASARLNPQLVPGYAFVGTPVKVGLIRVVNYGMTPLTVTGVSVSENFAATTDCAAPLPVLAACYVYVTFNPSAPGYIRGTVMIDTNSAFGPQTWLVEGYASDFAVRPSAGTATVQRGGNTDLTIDLSSTATSLAPTVAVALYCAGLPSGAQCAFDSPQLLLGAGNSSTRLTISMAAATVGLGRDRMARASLGLLGLALCGVVRRRRPSRATAIVVVLCAGLVASACGSDGAPPASPPPGGTPSSYTITVNATAGAAVRSTEVTLIVN